MGDRTRVTACKTKAEADLIAGNWRGANLNVVMIEGTDKVQLSDGGESNLLWESDAASDWTLVIGSKKTIVSVP